MVHVPIVSFLSFLLIEFLFFFATGIRSKAIINRECTRDHS
jgi:hypothetical protein